MTPFAVGLLSGIASFALGALSGAVAIARWWSGRMRDPAYAREALRGLYRSAHPHWLQVSETDPARVCPCCGWSPGR